MLLNDFITSQGYNCILGNVYNSMKYFQVDVLEQDLFFWFSPFDGDKNLPEVFEELYVDKGECGWKEFIKKSLNDGHPVLTSINPEVLPYFKVKVGDSSVKHYINIIGIDEDRKQLYVSDSYIPTYIPSTYEGWVDYSEISNLDIGNCWHLKSELLMYFHNNFGEETINNFTLTSIIKKLSSFLKKDGDNHKTSGIDNLRMMSKNVRNDIVNVNYNEIFKLLAGIRLNVINPLIYLIKVFERCPNEYSEWTERLNTLVNDHWEIVNIKLVKFALAHKKLDADMILNQIEKAIEFEKNILSDILKQLSWARSSGNNELTDLLKR